MKIKFLLILIAFLLHAVSGTAQSPTKFSTNDVFSIHNKSNAINRTAGILQNTKGNFKTFAESQTSTSANQLILNKLSANCNDFEFALAPAAPCNGASVTSINFSNASRTIVSGATNTDGVVYRYANAGVAPDGTVVDALVTVVDYSNNQDANQVNFRDADTTSVGFDGNLQPSLEQESNGFQTNTPWSGSINYRIQFVRTGTITPIVLSVAATTIDNDGSNACGGLRESVTYSTALNQVLTSNSTNQTTVGNKVTGPQVVQSGIGTGIDYANAALFVNVSEFNWTYSFATTGNCSTANASEDRFGSLNLSCQINFGRNFVSRTISGNVYNDTDGLTDNLVDGAGTNAGGLFANLLDSNGYVVSSATVAAGGAYTFPFVVAGNYSVQISTNQGAESSLAPTLALPAGWVGTGENLGAGAGSDGSVNSLLPLTVAAVAISNANFGIEQRPVANNNTAASQTNPGGTTNAAVPATTFTATDTATVSSIRITAFPSNSTTITINGTQYTAGNFPASGVTIPTNSSGNPTQSILIDPINGAMTVVIRYVAIDNASVESSIPPITSTASVPFVLAPTAANGEISGTLYFGGNPIRNALVVLYDTSSDSKAFTRTDANGNYFFGDREVGRTYIVQPLSSKFSFGSANSIVNLLDNATEINFNSTAKTYHPKNDFDGDGKSDAAVFRPSEGNWYVLRSSDNQMSVFNFGLGTDIPVSADFDGDGKTDYAVFRPSEGNWYIRQSKTQKLRVENFGLAGDKLVASDFDGDGKADVAVYRNGNWFIRRSSDGTFESKSFGLKTDIPITQDFDGDGKTDFSVYCPSDGNWYILRSSSNSFSSEKFGLATDIPSAGDFDGDGFADIAQFRNGYWYILNSTTDFETSHFGLSKDKSIVGDYDGDGRADTAVYRSGIWSIRNSADGSVRKVNFGLATDILVK
jgi:hypothetical protein